MMSQIISTISRIIAACPSSLIALITKNSNHLFHFCDCCWMIDSNTDFTVDLKADLKAFLDADLNADPNADYSVM